MPRAMRQLAVVQFFTWFALFCMWLYFVPAVATGVFHGQTLGLLTRARKSQIESEAGRPIWPRRRGSRGPTRRERRKLADEAARREGQHPWYNAVLPDVRPQTRSA